MYGNDKYLDICYMCVNECKKAKLAHEDKADRSCFIAKNWDNKSGKLGGVVYTTY